MRGAGVSNPVEKMVVLQGSEGGVVAGPLSSLTGDPLCLFQRGLLTLCRPG